MCALACYLGAFCMLAGMVCDYPLGFAEVFAGVQSTVDGTDSDHSLGIENLYIIDKGRYNLC